MNIGCNFNSCDLVILVKMNKFNEYHWIPMQIGGDCWILMRFGVPKWTLVNISENSEI